jgi:hypothetical protein
MVEINNYYATLERAMRLTRYIKYTCPRVYDTLTCNHLEI